VNKPTPIRRLQSTNRLRIPFHDLDPAGMVWHGRYFKYFEAARSALMDNIGYSYVEMKQSGLLWPIVDAQVRYVRPLSLHQDIYVSAVLKEWDMRLVVEYRIKDEKGLICTRAKTVQVAVDAETGVMRLGLPSEFVDRVDRLLSTAENDWG